MRKLSFFGSVLRERPHAATWNSFNWQRDFRRLESGLQRRCKDFGGTLPRRVVCLTNRIGKGCVRRNDGILERAFHVAKLNFFAAIFAGNEAGAINGVPNSSEIFCRGLSIDNQRFYGLLAPIGQKRGGYLVQIFRRQRDGQRLIMADTPGELLTGPARAGFKLFLIPQKIAALSPVPPARRY